MQCSVFVVRGRSAIFGAMGDALAISEGMSVVQAVNGVSE
jgi:hypothetical protein